LSETLTQAASYVCSIWSTAPVPCHWFEGIVRYLAQMSNHAALGYAVAENAVIEHVLSRH